MYSSELKTILLDSSLFSDNEIEDIIGSSSPMSIGGTIIACRELDILLTASGIDTLISCKELTTVNNILDSF